MNAQFVKLTEYTTGEPMWFNVNHIFAIQPRNVYIGDNQNRILSVLRFVWLRSPSDSDQWLVVAESPEQVLETIRIAGLVRLA